MLRVLQRLFGVGDEHRGGHRGAAGTGHVLCGDVDMGVGMCVQIRGVKWTATVWVHTKPFRPEEWDDVAKTFTRNDLEEDPGEGAGGGGSRSWGTEGWEGRRLHASDAMYWSGHLAGTAPSVPFLCDAAAAGRGRPQASARTGTRSAPSGRRRASVRRTTDTCRATRTR